MLIRRREGFLGIELADDNGGIQLHFYVGGSAP